MTALIQFGAKLTGFDVEYVIGNVDDDITKLFAIDYDQSRFWADKDFEATGLALALTAVPYVPYPEEKNLFDIFSESYIDMATQFGYDDYAKKVLKAIF